MTETSHRIHSLEMQAHQWKLQRSLALTAMLILQRSPIHTQLMLSCVAQRLTAVARRHGESWTSAQWSSSSRCMIGILGEGNQVCKCVIIIMEDVQCSWDGMIGF